MKRLAPNIEAALLAVLKQVNSTLNEHQARPDFAAIVELAGSRKAVSSGQTTKRKPGSQRPQGRLYILAYTAGEFYWAHTGHGPGCAGNIESKTVGGRYPRFVKLLADAMGLIDRATGELYTLKKVASACKKAREALNKEAGLAAMPSIEKDDPNNIRSVVEKARKDREPERMKILAPHVIGYECEGEPQFDPTGEIFEGEDGTRYVAVSGPEPILEGYQPTPDFERPASERFKDAISNLKKD